ncbi:MAG: hypothetical protein MI974_20190 [Chitinophagales bacterium]|nr:hypothetical protein [Chitinophagales bacterium]
MKNFLILIGLLFIAASTQAQSETLFSNSTISGFGAPIFSFYELNNEFATSGGGGGGLIIGDFFIGAFGEGVTLNNTILNNQKYKLDISYAGLWLGYSIMGKKDIHPFIGLKLAGGKSTIAEIEDNSTVQLDNIKVLQPEVGVEFNCTNWMRLVAHIGYRGILGFSDTNQLKPSQLSGVSSGITLRFGYF